MKTKYEKSWIDLQKTLRKKCDCCGELYKPDPKIEAITTMTLCKSCLEDVFENHDCHNDPDDGCECGDYYDQLTYIKKGEKMYE